MSHFVKLTYLSPLSSFTFPFLSSLCHSVLNPLFHLQHEIMQCWSLSVMEMTLSQRKSHSISFFSPSHSTSWRTDSVQCCTCTVMYGFKLTTSDTEKVAQGDFSQAVLTPSVTLAEFLTPFLQRWLNLSINLPKWAVESEGHCLCLFSIYQICPLVPGS